MKSITYFIVGLFILTLVFGVGNSFAQKENSATQYHNLFKEKSATQYINENLFTPQNRAHLAKFGSPGAGGPVAGGYSTPSGENTFAASTMIWSQLRTTEGGYLAEISDLMIDSAKGTISCVLLDRIQGMGAKDVLLPFSTVSKIGEAIFVYRAPEDVYQFHGHAPYWDEGLYLYSSHQKPAGSYTASKSIGAMVRTPKGEDLGRIDDLVIDSAGGQIVYLVVSQTGGGEGKMLTAPFSLLSRSGENAFVLETTKKEFETAPVFRSSDMTDSKYPEKIYTHYRLHPSEPMVAH